MAEVTSLKNPMDNVFYSIASGVISTDVQEQVVLVNRAAAAILGTAAASIVGHPLSEVLASAAMLIPPICWRSANPKSPYWI